MSCFSECVKLKEHLLANCIKIYTPNLIERLFLSVPLIGCLLEDVTLYSLLVFNGKNKHLERYCYPVWHCKMEE